MSDLVKSPMQYLEKATSALRDLGIAPPKTDDAPINALLEQITTMEPDKIAVIARTLNQASVFNEVVREQTAAMDIGTRYQDIANELQLDPRRRQGDGRPDRRRQARRVRARHQRWMKISRGDIADRFDAIKDNYLDVSRSTKDQIEREAIILEAYRDFRGALKQAEVLALEVLKTAEAQLAETKAKLDAAAADRSPASRARNRPTAPSSNWPATSSFAACRTRTSATRSPRTSPTTSRSATTRRRWSWRG